MRLSLRTIVPVLLASSVCLGAALTARPLVAATEAAPIADDHEAMHEAMETLQSGARSLRRGLKDAANNDASLETISGMQKAALVAFTHCPKPEAELDATNLAAWETNYKRGILAVANTLVDMEEQVRKGDNAAAQETWKKLMDQKKKGHDVYYPE